MWGFALGVLCGLGSVGTWDSAGFWVSLLDVVGWYLRFSWHYYFSISNGLVV